MADTSLGVLEKWVYQRLTADATLMALVDGVYAYSAPRGATGVVVTFQPSVAEDQMSMNGYRIGSYFRVTIKASGINTGMSRVDSVAERIDHLLHRSYDANALSSGFQLSGVRMAQVSYTEADAGVRYYHRGGSFEFMVHP